MIYLDWPREVRLSPSVWPLFASILPPLLSCIYSRSDASWAHFFFPVACCMLACFFIPFISIRFLIRNTLLWFGVFGRDMPAFPGTHFLNLECTKWQLTGTVEVKLRLGLAKTLRRGLFLPHHMLSIRVDPSCFGDVASDTGNILWVEGRID